MVGEDKDGTPVGNHTLGRRMCEIIADSLDFLLFKTKEARCNWIRICVQDLTIVPSFQRLADMTILVVQRILRRNGLEYGLANHFAGTLPQLPRFNVPEPVFCYIYPELNGSTPKESSNGDKYSL